jgi:hypothetical protein
MRLKTVLAGAFAALALTATPAAAQPLTSYDPATRAEAWQAYSSEITDGCWADFTSAYLGLLPDAELDHENDSLMALPSTTHPGYDHVWGPYMGACEDWAV